MSETVVSETVVSKTVVSETRKYFGTDGIRGCVGEGPITPEFMLKLGWAVGKVFANNDVDRSKVLIGKDTRISGYMFEAALEAGLTSAGVDINLLGPMPTPAIAYLTRTFHAQAGIVISASHNAYEDNGIKFFSSDGTKLADEVELAIEAQLNKSQTTVGSSSLGKASRMTDASGRYIEFCKSTIPLGVKLNGLKIVVDCAHGATYYVAPNVFDELGAKVTTMGVSPDGLNINAHCGSTSPERLAEKVVQENADLGIAFDGDGDRVVMVDHTGAIVDGDELLYIIAAHQRQSDGYKNGVVGTLMTNLGLELALAKLDVPFVRTNVGDRYVMEALKTRNWKLGGESSGHIICLGSTTTGDGIIAALQTLAAVVDSGKSLQELKQGMFKFPQTMINVKLCNKAVAAGNAKVDAAVTDIESKLGEKGRVLLRPSGTEPVIRVMVEGEDIAIVDKYAKELAEIVASELG